MNYVFTTFNYFGRIIDLDFFLLICSNNELKIMKHLKKIVQMLNGFETATSDKKRKKKLHIQRNKATPLNKLSLIIVFVCLYCSLNVVT